MNKINNFFCLITSFAILSMAPLFVRAKTVTQKGIAYLYDYKSKTKRPLAGVSFNVADAEPTKSNANGEFTLLFLTLKKGSKITNVRQPFFKGLKVFNKKTVDDWYIVDGKLELIMCDYEEFELVKKTYYEQGRKAAVKKYSQKIKKLEESLRQGKLREDEYEQMLQEERDNHQRILDNLNNSADEMARIDQSEISKQMQDVLSLYEQGEVDKAMEMMNKLHLAEGLDQAVMRKERSRKEYQEAVQDSAIAVRNIRSAVSLYNNNGDTEKEENLRWTLANRTQTPSDLFEYALFCSNNIAFKDSAEIYYAKVLDATKKTKEGNLFDLYLYATTMNNLSGIYYNRGEHEKGIQSIIEGLEGRRKYAKLSNDPNDENHVAWTLVSYANMKINLGNYEEGEKILKEADEIYIRIKPTYYENNEWIYGRLYDMFGWLYLKTDRLTDSEYYYKKSLELYSICVSQNPYDHLKSMIHIANWGLFSLYDKQGRYGEICDYLKKFQDLIKQYYQTNKKIKLLLPGVLNYLSYYVLFEKEYDIAEQYARESIDIDPDYHLPQTNLAAALLFQGKFSEAETIYRQYKGEFKKEMLDDLESFAANGIIPKEREADVEKIKIMLNEK